MMVYGLPLDFSYEVPWESLLRLVATDKREKLQKLAKSEDRLRGLFADLLVRIMIRKQLGVPDEGIRFEMNSYGKPFLSGWPIHFNVSHSGEWVAAAIDRQRIGIDIEKIEPVEIWEISRHFFNPEEIRDIERQPEEERLGTFFSIWTGKESYVKALGLGLSESLTGFYVNRQESRIMTREACGEGDWFLRMYDISPNYRLSVCSESQAFPEQPTILSLDQLMSMIRQTL